MTQLETIQADITAMAHDAIVNAANPALAGGGGVDGAIHRAGGPSILEECQKWVATNGHLPTGAAVATTAGDLKSRFVIHTVGPIWGEHAPVESRRLLSDCYLNSLALAASKDCDSVAFPNISTGVYGFPKGEAAEVAIEATTEWIEENPTLGLVTFVCFDEENLRVYSDLLGP